MNKKLKDSTIDDLNENELEIFIPGEMLAKNIYDPEDFREEKQPENFREEKQPEDFKIVVISEVEHKYRLRWNEPADCYELDSHIGDWEQIASLYPENIDALFFGRIKATKGTDQEWRDVTKIVDKIIYEINDQEGINIGIPTRAKIIKIIELGGKDE